MHEWLEPLSEEHTCQHRHSETVNKAQGTLPEMDVHMKAAYIKREHNINLSKCNVHCFRS